MRRRLLLGAAALLAALAVAALARAGTAPTLSNPLAFALGASPRGIAVGDFNADGKPDVATANPVAGTGSILLGNGDGTLQTPTAVLVGGDPAGLAVGDFNGDGNSDLAVETLSAATLFVLLGTGNGTFQSPTAQILSPFKFADLTVGDFNGDGKSDLAISNFDSSYVYVLLGNGGTFSFAPKIVFSVGTRPRGVAASDLSGDGKVDLAIAINNGASGAIANGNGDGTFQTPIFFPLLNGPVAVAVGLFDPGTYPDLAFALSTGPGPASQLFDVLGPTPTAPPFTIDKHGPFPEGGTDVQAIAVGDFDGDRHDDLVATNGGTNNISVIPQSGGLLGAFQAPTVYAAGNGPSGVAVADFNGDGKPDIVVADGADNGVSVLLNGVAAARQAVSGATTVSTGGATSADVPLQTSLTTPSGTTGGTVTIVTSNTGTGTFGIAGEQVNITQDVTPVPTASSPLVLTFTVDSSIIPTGQTAATLEVFKDGTGPLADCPGAVTASPDPCVSDRTALPDGSAQITVLTSTTSTWTFGFPIYAFAGFFDPVDNLPVLNAMQAGRAVPVKFSLGGFQGTEIFASDYPKSQQISCTTSAPVSTVEETVTAGSSSLSYDAATDTYRYTWKTDRSWAGTCRQLVARLADGTYRRASFIFK